MGNEISISETSLIKYTKYKTTDDLYIHSDKNNNYFISSLEFLSISSNSLNNNFSYYYVPRGSLITINRFLYNNNQLKLMAFIRSELTTNINRWNLVDTEVNVISLFSLEASKKLEEYNII